MCQGNNNSYTPRSTHTTEVLNKYLYRSGSRPASLTKSHSGQKAHQLETQIQTERQLENGVDPGNPLSGQSRMQITQLNKQQALREGWGGSKGLGNAQRGRLPARRLWSMAPRALNNVKQRMPFQRPERFTATMRSHLSFSPK